MFTDRIKKEKALRLLDIYERLSKGELLNKAHLSFEYGVSEKTIQRDFNDLRVFFLENRLIHGENDLIYDKKVNGYRLIKYERSLLKVEETTKLIKIINQSDLCDADKKTIINKLIDCTSGKDRNLLDI